MVLELRISLVLHLLWYCTSQWYPAPSSGTAPLKHVFFGKTTMNGIKFWQEEGEIRIGKFTLSSADHGKI